MRSEHGTRSYWALIVIIVVLILFGLFWYWQTKQISPEGYEFTPIPSSPYTSQTPSDTEGPINISDLQASAVSIPIPSFDKLF